MNQSVDRAIVLSRTNYGERDRVISLLTENGGKITVFAKGVRAQKSRLAGGVELLSITDITYVEGKTALKTLTSSRLIKHFARLAQNMASMQRAFAAIKIIDKLAEDGGGQEYFGLLSNYFVALDDPAYDQMITEMWFNLRLLSLSGAAPSTEDLKTDKYQFNFDHDNQIFKHHPEGLYNQGDIKLIKLLITQSKPIKLKQPLGSEAQLLQLSKLMLQANINR